MARQLVLTDADTALADEVAQFYDDPLGHVLWSYPWGEGSLTGRTGPDKWQAELLTKIGDEIRKRGFDGVDGHGVIANQQNPNWSRRVSGGFRDWKNHAARTPQIRFYELLGAAY